ncbi:MAG: DUF5615 family PIN-like protein [Candidatus Zhuqueibacterota bacterium]
MDEDVSVLLVKILQARGFNAITALDSEMLAKDDPEQLAFAVLQGRCILTHNRKHFEEMHSHFLKNNWSHSGIIIANRRPVYELLPRILSILNELTADEMVNNLIYI